LDVVAKIEANYLILDPKVSVPLKNIEIFKKEQDYWSSMTLNDVTQVGPERI